jgi:hypothetical protein
VFNLTAVAHYPVAKFEEELYKIMYDHGLVVGMGTDTFIGPKTVVPNGPGPYIHINRTSGFEPLETHDGAKYQRLTAQIAVRASSYVVARDKAIAIWRVLDGQRNVSITAA